MEEKKGFKFLQKKKQHLPSDGTAEEIYSLHKPTNSLSFSQVQKITETSAGELTAEIQS